MKGVPLVFDRLVKHVITLILLLFFAQAAIGLVRTLGPASSVVVALLTVGLLIRGVDFIRKRGPQVRKSRLSGSHPVRQRVRRPAENVQVHRPERPHPDPDPAINEEDE